MAWRIRDWSPESGHGTVEAPGVGILEFLPSANVDNVPDFIPDEVVWVELDGAPGCYEVTLVRPMAQHQPQGTQASDFAVFNGRFVDVYIEQHNDDTLSLWLGNCCMRCTPDGFRVGFAGISSVHGLDDDTTFSSPHFRMASEAEIEANALVVPTGSRAFCIVTSHGEGLDGPSVLIVATSVEVTSLGDELRAEAENAPVNGVAATRQDDQG